MVVVLSRPLQKSEQVRIEERLRVQDFERGLELVRRYGGSLGNFHQHSGQASAAERNADALARHEIRGGNIRGREVVEEPPQRRIESDAQDQSHGQGSPCAVDRMGCPQKLWVTLCMS